MTSSNHIEWGDTHSLYEAVARRAQAFPSGSAFLESVADKLEELWGDKILPVDPTIQHVGKIVRQIYEAERNDVVPPSFEVHLLGTLQGARYRDELLALVNRTATHNVDLMRSILTRLFIRYFLTLPPSCYQDTPETFKVRLIDQAQDIPGFIETVIEDITRPIHPTIDVFSALRRQLDANRETLKNRAPSDFKGTASELVRAYFQRTPLEGLFDIHIPFGIPEHVRYHTAIIAKTRWGKSQLLQSLILEEIEKPEPSSVIVLDSTGAMTDLIQKLAVFNDKLKDRLLIIDPAHSPALNMFDVSNPRLQNYSDEIREDVESELVALFNYIFSSSKYDLSAQMGMAFSYAIKLVFSMRSKGVTLNTLRKVLEETPKGGLQGSAFREDIMAMDENARDFFANHFYASTFGPTKAQIARRIHQLIVIPAFARMFTAATNALDLHADTQERASIILVNTNESVLKEDSYILFGRYIIARTVAAMLERSTIPENERRITHLIIDEAAPYFDETFDTLLTRVGKYKLKVTVAFQHFDQLNDKLRNSVAGQTSVKYIGGLSHTDERRIANEIRCTPEFLSNLERDASLPPQWADFAVFADGLTKTAVKVRLPFFQMENQPMMTQEQHQALLARNRARVVSKISAAPPHPVQHPTAQPARRDDDTTAKSEPPGPSTPDTPETGSTW